MMSGGEDPISLFYLKHLGGTWQETISSQCPFCEERGFEPGRLQVFLKKESFFHGYFRCLNRCVPGGYPLWFARLKSLPLTNVPGHDPDQEQLRSQTEFPVDNINDEVEGYRDMVTKGIVALFKKRGVGASVLQELKIGFNGRYIVYPYIQEDENCYSARCVHPEKKEDYFWQGDEKYSKSPFDIFNVQELSCCENGTLFLCEGERNLVTLKQLGFPGIAVPHYSIIEKLPGELFSKINTLFIAVANRPESENAARSLAAKIGHKARILAWPHDTPRRYNLWHLAADLGAGFRAKMVEMIKSSQAFSPFSSPKREYQLFLQTLQQERGDEYLRLYSGFKLLDEALGGVHGLNVIGGAPKVGKSTFTIQIGAEMALRKIPVLYYDFENGRQKIYQRTISRLARVEMEKLKYEKLTQEESARVADARTKLEQMLFYWRVINDRKISPELMRKHIEFIRHETRSEYTIVVVDSLHKLPFKEFSERRTGIDAWLRQMESIRDELKVSFLVISELSRGSNDSYEEQPHLGIFKGSGDIEYSADNAMVLFPDEFTGKQVSPLDRFNSLWLVASREHSPGNIANYHLDYPFWGFTEKAVKLSES